LYTNVKGADAVKRRLTQISGVAKVARLLRQQKA
jgi:hypothetical protein